MIWHPVEDLCRRQAQASKLCYEISVVVGWPYCEQAKRWMSSRQRTTTRRRASTSSGRRCRGQPG